MPATTSHAQEAARFALLISNQSYDPSVGVLRNPHKDAALVAAALEKRGFTLLPPVKDARRIAILAAVRGLVQRLNSASGEAIGFLYYSGHGAAEKDTNVNYIIPIDAVDPGTAALWDESLKLDDILHLFDGAQRAAKFLVFDACRNELYLPQRTSDKGLIPVSEHQGMFIAYATAPGHTASDRGEVSGPYAAALVSELEKPGLDHLNLFQNVKEAVLAKTGGAQQPWESNGLARRIYLTGQPESMPQLGTTSASEVERAWSAIRESQNPLVFEAFNKQFPGTVYAALAGERIAMLKRQADDRKRTEATEDRRKAKEATATCLAEEAKTEPRAAPKALEDSLQHEVRLQIQEMLKRQGRLEGNLDGVFGTATRNAIMAFQRNLNAKPTGFLTPCQLQALWTDSEEDAHPSIARTR